MSAEKDDNSWSRLKKTVKPLKKGDKRYIENLENVQDKPKSLGAQKPAKTSSTQSFVKKTQAKEAAVNFGTGIDRSTDDKLRRGQMKIQARLDLHGMDKISAYKALEAFVSRNWEMQRRVLLVITGKSGGVLRAALPRWLKEPGISEKVLVFHPAQPRDGGTGAFYVLLRRQRGPKR